MESRQIPTEELKRNSSLRVKHTGATVMYASRASILADVVITNKKTYNLFCDKYTGFSRNETRNTIHDYRAVIHALNQYYVDYALDTGHLVVLPNNLGKIGIKRFKNPLKQNPHEFSSIGGYLNIFYDFS